MDDAPWMPPGQDADTPRLPDPATPETPSPWARGGDESAIAPTLPAAVPAPPAPPTQPLTDPFAAAPAGFAPPAASAEMPPVDPVPPAKRSRSKALVGAAVVGVLAVGAAGVFAVQSFGGSSKGGAATPEELGTSLLTAIENEDVLGVVDVLSPGERDVFRQPMIDLVSELTRLEVLSPEADLGKIEGFDVVLENEVVTPESTNVPDIVNVRLQADSTITVDGAAVPVGDLVTDNMDAADVEDMRTTSETTEEPFDEQLTAVEIDGRWYFSLFYSAAETARRDASFDEELQIPVEGIGAVGADSPEAAMNQVLDSVQALDVRLLMQSLNPGEASALQRYAPLFIDDAEAALDDVPLKWEITTRDFRVEGEGDTRTVFVDALAIEGDIDGESFTFAVNGDCVKVEAMEESFEQCAGDAIAQQQVDEFLAEMPEVKAFLDAMSEAFADVEPIGLELREFDGQWYVSPISTFSEAVLKVLRALDREEIDRLIDLGESAVEEGFGSFFGDLSGDDDFVIDESFEEMTTGDMSFEDMSFEEMTTGDISFGDDSFGSFETVPPAAYDACYSESDAAAAAACFQPYIESGEIDPFMVPIELRFPECNYGAAWNGGLYSMDDATFTATVEAARPCFLALVESGTIELWELPHEIAYFDCFEGRNWYTTYDDPEYDARYYACIDAAVAGG